MQEVIREEIKKPKWGDEIKEKTKKVVGLMGAGGRIGISWQLGNKEFFVGVSMQTIEIERLIKIKTSRFKVHSGSGRVLNL